MKTKKITKSMKYRIKYNKELYDILREVQYTVWKVKNKTTTLAWDWQQFSFSYHERFNEHPKSSAVLGKRLDNDIYNQLKELGEDINSSTFNTAITESVKKFQNDLSDILKGNVTIANYRRDGSFPIRTGQIKNIKRISQKQFSCNLGLLSNKRVKELRDKCKDREKAKGIKTQIPATLLSGGAASQIMDRIISGEYKLCDSRITQDRKGRFYLIVVYQFEQSLVLELDENRIMGIDIGVNTPAMLAISDNKYYRQEVGSSQEVKNFQRQVEARKRSLQRSRKWAGEGSVGHGVKTRIKPLKKLSGKIKRFKDTKNHNWSRYIVNEAIRNNCGIIQMEDLSEISENNIFLKTWTYYDLQQKIEYKAKEVGIDVVKVEPAHTSARCSKCGHIHSSDSKDEWRPTQDQFKCMKCDFGHRFYVNADWNAAKNIATKDIDKIIKRDKERQEKELKHNLKYVI